jgi:hypothetical protein
VPDKEDVFILVLAASAAVVGYFVSNFFEPQYGLSIGVSVFLLLIGAGFYRVEASWSRLLGSLIMAAGAGTFVAAMLGPFAGAVAFLLSLVYFLMRTLLSED